MDIAIITPSYAPDYQRCKLLCESIKKFVTNYKKHVIVVDKQDYELFKSLENDKTEIVIKQEILPRWIIKLPLLTKWWLSLKSLPVRGWILQQIVKLSTHEFVDAEVYIFADSDVVFIRPFDASSVIDNGKVRLCSTSRKQEDYNDKRKQSWHLYAAKSFAINDSEILTRDYISQLVCWRRDTLQKLTKYLSGNKHDSWKEKLCNNLDFSEYILYGIFVEHILDEDSGHYRDSQELCYCSWHENISNEIELNNFLNNVPRKFNSVLVQSNLNIEMEYYREQILALQDSNNQK